jgi:hypothetical protein
MMIGSPLVGAGVLIVNEQRFDGAQYRIEVHRTGKSHLVARGVLHPPQAAIGAATEAFNVGRALLQLASGHIVEIVPSRFALSEGARSLEFTVNGPVPGF